jgi:hypothetical protein
MVSASRPPRNARTSASSIAALRPDVAAASVGKRPSSGWAFSRPVRRYEANTSSFLSGRDGHRKKVSVIGAVTVSPQAQRTSLYFANRVDGHFDAGAVVGFPRDLLRALVGKVVVVWDGGANHKGLLSRESLRRNERLTRERLPAYAHDLNPVKAV